MKIGMILLSFALSGATVFMVFGAGDQEKFGGLGVVVAQLYDQDTPDHRGELVVLGFSSEMPSAREGLHPGDVIVSVDGHQTKGKPFEKVVRENLRGIAGSTASLSVRRIGHAELLNLQIPRVQLKG